MKTLHLEDETGEEVEVIDTTQLTGWELYGLALRIENEDLRTRWS